MSFISWHSTLLIFADIVGGFSSIVFTTCDCNYCSSLDWDVYSGNVGTDRETLFMFSSLSVFDTLLKWRVVSTTMPARFLMVVTAIRMSLLCLLGFGRSRGVFHLAEGWFLLILPFYFLTALTDSCYIVAACVSASSSSLHRCVVLVRFS